jgi:hypothetical protein
MCLQQPNKNKIRYKARKQISEVYGWDLKTSSVGRTRFNGNNKGAVHVHSSKEGCRGIQLTGKEKIERSGEQAAGKNGNKKMNKKERKEVRKQEKAKEREERREEIEKIVKEIGNGLGELPEDEGGCIECGGVKEEGWMRIWAGNVRGMQTGLTGQGFWGEMNRGEIDITMMSDAQIWEEGKSGRAQGKGGSNMSSISYEHRGIMGEEKTFLSKQWPHGRPEKT